MQQGANCKIGNYVTIAEDAVIGDHARVGNNVTIYPGVTLGDNSIVMDGAVLGRLPHRTPVQNLDVITDYEPLTIARGCVIGCNCVIYTGVTMKENAAVHDLSVVREHSVLAEDVVLARSVYLQPGTLIGARTRIMDLVELPGPMLVEADVFIAPGVMMANDRDGYLTRFRLHSPHILKGPTIRRYAMLGPNATLLPAVEIGEGAHIAAGAVVTKDVPAWTVMAGVPAKPVRAIPPEWREKVLEYGRKQDENLKV